MLTKTITIEKFGLNTRPASLFIQKANSFKSSVWIENSDRRANAKSLLGVLSLGIKKGDSVSIIADGPDEEQAIDSLVDLILSLDN